LEASLRSDPELNVTVVDGNKGEFTVDVDGRKIDALSGESFRATDEIAREVRGPALAG
jgi:hypothetical protein